MRRIWWWRRMVLMVILMLVRDGFGVHVRGRPRSIEVRVRGRRRCGVAHTELRGRWPTRDIKKNRINQGSVVVVIWAVDMGRGTKAGGASHLEVGGDWRLKAGGG